MRTIITLSDETARELLAATGTDDLTQAVSMAVEAFLRRHRLEDLRALRGKVDILSNDELEATEPSELK